MIADWLQLHALDRDMIRDCLAALDSRQIDVDLLTAPDTVQTDSAPCEGAAAPAGLAAALQGAVQPALTALLGGGDRIAPLMGQVSLGPLCGDTPPHTMDHADGRPPEIRIGWAGSDADLICLAHEMAHALQLLLSAGSFMPPVARETCAFLGELALMDWAATQDPGLAARLVQVWRSENRRYLGEDVALLRAALADPQAQYSYRMNYPLARIAAVCVARSGAGPLDLFKAGQQAMGLLPLGRIADLCCQMENYLPSLPLPDPARPALDAYRSLGAIALLDIDVWKGCSEQRIDDYYAALLHHFQNRTAFVALDAMRRPVGYATWHPAEGRDGITLTRQAAPFGDHLMLQHALARHLRQSHDVRASHPRSARQDQTAW